MAPTSNQTLHEALKRASLFLEKNGKEGRLAKHYWMLSFDWTLTELVQALHQQVKIEDLALFEKILQRIVKDEPIQYILGYTEFMNHTFKVNSNTLIPREETAGIIELALNLYPKNTTINILDIGTGSGVLAILLALNFEKANVTAVDISKSAINVAKYNANELGAKVQFIESDLISAIKSETSFDLVVSNPPYISANELELMDESVKKYEPSLALFADNNGLAIYERLAVDLPSYLSPQAKILLEIGFQQGEAVKKIFKKAFPLARVYVKQDYNHLDRYVVVEL